LASAGEAAKTAWKAAGREHYHNGAFADAVASWENLRSVEDSDAELHHAIGRARYYLGEIGEAVRHLRRAAALSDSVNSWIALATVIPGNPAATNREVLETRRLMVERLAAAHRWAASGAERRPDRVTDRIRVGYLSAHFDLEGYMKPVWGVINRHDRDRIEVVLLADCSSECGFPGYRADPSDRLEPVSELDNHELAELIRDLGIDVLVDLSSYSVAERLPLFLDPPAPVTVAWFNMYATSGLPGIQHIVGDHTVAPPGEDVDFSEQVHRVAGSYLAFEVLHEAPPVAPPPCLENGFLTFGGLISQYKVTPRMLDIWAELLRRAPTGRLLLGNRVMGVESNRSYLLDRLRGRGVDTDRVILLGPRAHSDFLGYYDRIDVALDSYPYNGGTTTSEALWQGVPVLTYPGDRWVSRTSASLLRGAGLDRWIAPDEDGMLEAAVALAGNPGTPARLESLRSRMRSRLRSSATCDCVGLARQLETIYRVTCSRPSHRGQ